MNIFELAAKINCDTNEFEKSIGKAQGLASSAASGIRSALSTIAKVGAGAFAAAGAAVGAMAKQAVTAYGEYEQLKGGVETLFGTNGKSVEEYAKYVGKTVDAVKEEYSKLEQAQSTVLNNASRAFMTAGLDTNAYIDTVTGFSASLIGSLDGDTVKAAELADRAIRDMADNANKMGTDIGSIQNAYQGFAKQNYTMLDNLKLGYGGTKEEMARLLSDAEKLSGQKFDISSYADVVTAIGVIQDKMQITGTTAEEASKTIQGSLAMTASAWQNLVAGLANDDANLDQLIGDLIFSVDKAARNVIPRFGQALKGVGKMVSGLAPVITEQLPPLIKELVPTLVDSAVELLKTLSDAVVTNLPDMITTIIETLQTLAGGLFDIIAEQGPMFVDSFWEIVDILAENIGQMVETLIPYIVENAPAIIDGLIDGLISTAEHLYSVGETLVDAVMTGFANADFSQYGDMSVESIVRGLLSKDTSLIQAGTEMLPNIITGIQQSLPEILNEGVNIVSGLFDALVSEGPSLAKAGFDMIMELIKGFVSSLPSIASAATDLYTNFSTSIMNNFPQIVEMGISMIAELIAGIIEAIPDIVTAILTITDKMRESFMNYDWATLGLNIIEGVCKGLLNAEHKIGDALAKAAANAYTKVTDFFQIKSPSRLMRDMVGKNIVLGWVDGIDENAHLLNDASKRLAQGSYRAMNADYSGNAYNAGLLTTRAVTSGDVLADNVSRMTNAIGNIDNTTNVRVVLEGDAEGMIRILRTENERAYTSNGRGIFAGA